MTYPTHNDQMVFSGNVSGKTLYQLCAFQGCRTLSDEEIEARCDKYGIGAKSAVRKTANKIKSFAESGHDFEGGFSDRYKAIKSEFSKKFGEEL